jgi:chromosome segregation ATPase
MLTFGNKYSYLILLCVGFVLGFYFCSLFSGCGRQASSVPAVTIVKPEVIQKRAAAAEAGYQVKIDSLGAAAKNLQVALQTSQSALDKAKKKNIALQTQVYDLLDRSAAAPTDTDRRIMDCDSLETKVKDLVINDNLKDSLYEETTTNLQAQVNNKDSTLQVQREQYQELKASFTQSLQQQGALQTENTALRKSVRHEKRAGVFRTIGLAIAAALAAHYLTR